MPNIIPAPPGLARNGMSDLEYSVLCSMSNVSYLFASLTETFVTESIEMLRNRRGKLGRTQMVYSNFLRSFANLDTELKSYVDEGSQKALMLDFEVLQQLVLNFLFEPHKMTPIDLARIEVERRSLEGDLKVANMEIADLKARIQELEQCSVKPS